MGCGGSKSAALPVEIALDVKDTKQSAVAPAVGEVSYEWPGKGTHPPVEADVASKLAIGAVESASSAAASAVGGEGAGQVAADDGGGTSVSISEEDKAAAKIQAVARGREERKAIQEIKDAKAAGGGSYAWPGKKSD
jgi:hypothetical protein